MVSGCLADSGTGKGPFVMFYASNWIDKKLLFVLQINIFNKHLLHHKKHGHSSFMLHNFIYWRIFNQDEEVDIFQSFWSIPSSFLCNLKKAFPLQPPALVVTNLLSLRSKLLTCFPIKCQRSLLTFMHCTAAWKTRSRVLSFLRQWKCSTIPSRPVLGYDRLLIESSLNIESNKSII